MPFRALLLTVALIACSPPQAAPADPAAVAANEASHGVSVQTPRPNARITSPVLAAGVAPNSWYFEGVFQAKLLSADGAVIAEAQAQGQTDWTVPGPVRFTAELPFHVAVETPATLLLREDMPDAETDGEPGRTIRPTREIRIPVTLLPPAP